MVVFATQEYTLQIVTIIFRRIILWSVNRATTTGNAITSPRLFLFLDVLLTFTSGVLFGITSGVARAVAASIVAAISAMRLSRPCFPPRLALYDPGTFVHIAQKIVCLYGPWPHMPISQDSVPMLRC